MVLAQCSGFRFLVASVNPRPVVELERSLEGWRLVEPGSRTGFGGAPPVRYSLHLLLVGDYLQPSDAK